jgi:transposase
MERADRETWAKRVERWKDSGLSAKEFATEIGVTPKALSWWKWQLARSAQGPKTSAPRPRKERKLKTALSPMTFVEMAQRLGTGVLEIVWPSGVTIRVPADVDPGALARVIEVIEKRR